MNQMPDLDLVSPFQNFNEPDSSHRLAKASSDQRPGDIGDLSPSRTRDRIDSEDFILSLNLEHSKDCDFLLPDVDGHQPIVFDETLHALSRRKSSFILAYDPTLNQLEVS